jgi:large subunit ribosomal protein L4
MKTDLYSEKGTKLSTRVDLPGDVFEIDPNEAALKQYIHVYQTNQRRGTVKTKTRSEVSGGGRKPWRQKGTGRARHGSTRSPIWIGGGIAHGPQPRKFALSVPKKIAKLALRSALSLKAKEGKIKLLEGLSFEVPKASAAAKLLGKLKLGKRILVVIPGQDENLYRSFRNLEGVEVRATQNLNAYDVVLARDLVLLRGSIGKIEERLGKKETGGKSGKTGGAKSFSSKSPKKEIKKNPVKGTRKKTTKPGKEQAKAKN